MRAAWFVIASIGCGSGHPGTDAATACKANLEAAISRACTTAADCVLVQSADCCGTIVLGIAATSEPAFASAEATYVACLNCGPRGCQHADLAEDGKSPGAGEAIVATCDANRCKSIVAPAAQCGPSGACSGGPACGASCCKTGEHCSNGTCMCGTNPACVSGDMCVPPGPIGGDACGSVCCGITGPCPQ